MKKFIAFLLSVINIVAVFNGCQVYNDPVETLQIQPSQDKYRNYYEIFVGSFCDSDGDNIGDIKGIISKLDYLNDGNPETDTDLGIDGIWLTPIMPSQSYHKYDVIDYYDIDKSFGTIDDFKTLVNECHKRGINVIIDMVLNHCSKFMPLFEQACQQALNDDLSKSAKYFEIDKYDVSPGNNYTSIGNGYYYESNFSPYMPEWNLDSKATRKYFIDVAKFWINECKVDGFRLDAVKYFDDENTNGEDFLKWYYNEVKKINKDVYMVGELWTGNSDISEMYKSKIDSLFAFGFAGATGAFVNSVRSQSDKALVSQLMKYTETTKNENPDAINSYFISNHDQIRSGNYLKVNGESFTKMLSGVYMLVPGNSFIYYGEEIGMIQNSLGNGDEYKREPMIWDTNNPPEIIVNGITSYDETQGIYGGVEQQQKDKNSILNYYKRVIKIKGQNPEIARGYISENCDFEDTNLCGYYIKYKDSKILIIHNLSSESEKEISLDKNLSLRGDLVASDNNKKVSFKNGVLKMPPQSTVILK